MHTEFPGYAIVEHHIKRNADKQTYGKLTYDVMEAFIAGHETDDKKRAAMLKEYETILAAFPSMTVKVQSKERKNNAITYATMDDFIRIMPDSAANYAEYERVKKMSLAYRCAYKFVAAWFEETFPHYGELLLTDEKGNPVWDAVAMCQKAEEQAAKPKLMLMKNA